MIMNYLCIFSVVLSHITNCVIFPGIIYHLATFRTFNGCLPFIVGIHRWRGPFVESISKELLLPLVSLPGMVIKGESTIPIIIQLWKKQFLVNIASSKNEK